MIATRLSQTLFSGAAILALGSLTAAPLAAESATMVPQIKRPTDASVYVPATELSQFRPAGDVEDHRIDYSYLDEALRWMVVPMGPSLRETAPRVDPRLGTRRIQGHESRFRLEGNRIAFSFFSDDIRVSLTEYRKDLERVGSNLDLTRLPRNEQLAFWLNLHNVAMIEALANEYPLGQPDQRQFGGEGVKLDDAKLVTVRGVALSPRDIRERIVYPNWNDPKVMYGFWRGEIGGPSIQRLAFSGSNVSPLLDASAKEFVNSLRGVQKYNGALQVSEIYREAAPFYFESTASLRGHIAQYGEEDVQKLLRKTDRIAYSPDYERDLADLSRGEVWSVIDQLSSDVQDGLGQRPVRFRVNYGIQRLMTERQEKLRRAVHRGVRLGTVIVEGEEGVPSEVQ